MDENKRNILTGTFLKQHDDTKELNSVTGVSQDVKNKDSVCKSDKTRWPSISEQDKRNEDSEPNPVNKSTDSCPWPSISKSDEESEDDREFEKVIPIFPVEKKGDEHICCGIVYEPDTVDSQGDQANAEEIRKAAYGFMENIQTFKVMHKGKPAKVKVLESYIAPQDLTINKRKIKKGSWVLVTRVLDKKLWKDIKSGKYTGYSMAGYAKVD